MEDQPRGQSGGHGLHPRLPPQRRQQGASVDGRRVAEAERAHRSVFESVLEHEPHRESVPRGIEGVGRDAQIEVIRDFGFIARWIIGGLLFATAAFIGKFSTVHKDTITFQVAFS